MLEAQEYLAGRNISLQNMYRMCYLMAKLLLSEGLGALEVRERIFAWGSDNGIYIKPSVNSIIEKASNDRVILNGDIEVWVGNQDVEEIIRRFDRKIARCDALAMLCYSKVYANRRGEFTLPCRSLAAWVGFGALSTHWDVIRELITFEYIELVDYSRGVRRWDKKNLSDKSVYRVIAPVSSAKDYRLIDNKILDLHNTIFDSRK